MPKLIDGKKIALEIKNELKTKVEQLKREGKDVCLAVIQVGNDAASTVYVNGKKRDCEYIGIRSLSYELPEETTMWMYTVFLFNCLFLHIYMKK